MKIDNEKKLRKQINKQSKELTKWRQEVNTAESRTLYLELQADEKELSGGGFTPPYMPLFSTRGATLCRSEDINLQSPTESTQTHVHPMVQHS